MSPRRYRPSRPYAKGATAPLDRAHGPAELGVIAARPGDLKAAANDFLQVEALAKPLAHPAQTDDMATTARRAIAIVQSMQTSGGRFELARVDEARRRLAGPPAGAPAATPKPVD